MTKASISKHIQELLHSLNQVKPPRELDVVVMPDFFLDRLLTYDGDAKQLYNAVADVARRKGGSIHGVKQTELRGGNAANTAAALAALGAKVHPIMTTDSFGLRLLKLYLRPLEVDLSHVKDNGKISLTTAFELVHHEERVNIMMSDLGSLERFGPDDLTPEDLQLLRETDYVCVFHWAGTRRWGTELARNVFSQVKKEGRGKTYYDTSDPTPREGEIPALMRKVLLTDVVDILSVNENEAFCYASQLDHEVSTLPTTLNPREVAKECARTLAKKLSARIDLHTTSFAGSFTRKDEVVVPAFKVPVVRATGAGDAWNAGNILGDALGLSDSSRLALANAVAAYYISSPTGEHPTLSRLVDFCSKRRR